MGNLYLTKENVEESLKCTSNKATTLMRQYKRDFKKMMSAKLMDNQTIPTYFFVYKYAEEYKLSEKTLCTLFGYDHKMYLADIEMHVTPKKGVSND